MRATEWLEKVTGRSSAWWMTACQEAIKKESKPTEDPNHSENDPETFRKDVAHLVCTSLPKSDDYDSNMRVAAIMGVVLSLWKARVHYAKTQDPNRPIESRQRSYAAWFEWAQVLGSLSFDERDDPAYFPGQKWDHPYAFDAKDGGFV
jgi:hypothetical protein